MQFNQYLVFVIFEVEKHIGHNMFIFICNPNLKCFFFFLKHMQ
jgi:hypothetical protein